MAFEILEIVSTPNPNAMKFVLDRSISDQPISFLTAESADQHPLAKSLFSIPGVTSVLFLGDFVTINKSPKAKWPEIQRNVKNTLKNA